ncbi:MAG TPA: hypothetical protein VHK69_13910 [Chitinophagaceae bacterium]|jgi:tetratricopeptide (TPR) repeat protein|nr:hypothetical protein [Chitinophagaceae bacterium]
MNESIPDSEALLMRYLDGELSDAERSVFEVQLAGDPALQQRLESLRSALAAVRLHGIREEVASVHRSLKAEGALSAGAKVVPLRTRVFRALAVAASVLMVVAGVQAYRVFSVTPETAWSEAYAAYELPVLRGETDSASALVAAYGRGEYETVRRLALEHRKLTPKEELLTGLVHLDRGLYGPAVHHFNRVLAIANPYRPDAEFYRSLAYLRQGRLDEAAAEARRIRNTPGHPYAQQFTDKYLRQLKWLQWREGM